MRHAEILAEYLGEPYGTLVLTIAAVSIEVTIMAAVMLTGGPNPTLPRDTVYDVLMIVLNGMIGLSVVIGAWRHHEQQYNLQGAVAFLAVISSLAVLSLVLPTFIASTKDQSMTTLQAVAFSVLTALLYGGFLIIQTVRHRTFFLDVSGGDRGESHHGDLGPKHSLAYHLVLLVANLLPVVLLGKPLGKVIDYDIEGLNAPTTLGGIVIAIVVLSPEGVSSLRAAQRN